MIEEAKSALAVYQELYDKKAGIENIKGEYADLGLCYFAGTTCRDKLYRACESEYFIYATPVKIHNTNGDCPDNPRGYTEPWQALLPRIELLKKLIDEQQI